MASDLIKEFTEENFDTEAEMPRGTGLPGVTNQLGSTSAQQNTLDDCGRLP